MPPTALSTNSSSFSGLRDGVRVGLLLPVDNGLELGGPEDPLG